VPSSHTSSGDKDRIPENLLLAQDNRRIQELENENQTLRENDSKRAHEVKEL